MFNCFQVSLAGRVLGLFPNNVVAAAFAQDHADVSCIDYDEYEIKGRFLPGLPF